MMEKPKCKVCLRNFSNGRALGGHMRSHMRNLPIPPKPNESPPTIQLSFEAESASSSFEEENKGLSYGLRENPKKSSRILDPEFKLVGTVEASSVIVQDRESETESSKNLTRKRPRTTRKLIKRSEKNESASSASDTTTEEDVAFCLMMLSRDKWKRQQHHKLMEEEEEQYEDEEEEQEDEDEEEEESDDVFEELKSVKVNKRVRGRYKCDTCNKVFRSYQALGGHRASHKKIKVVEEHESEHENNNVGDSVPLVVEKKIHECPVCFRVFASGQALGGHKRTHVIGSAQTATTTIITEVRTVPKFGDTLIDLNLPAPMDDEDVSQIEDSAVSDAEFVKSR